MPDLERGVCLHVAPNRSAPICRSARHDTTRSRDNVPVEHIREVADRVLMISEIETPDGYAVVLSESVFIQAGEEFWTEGQGVAIRRASGRVERIGGAWETRCR